MALSVSLLDDQFFFGKSRKATHSRWGIVAQVSNVVIHGVILYGVWVFYGLKFNGTHLDANIGKNFITNNDSLRVKIILFLAFTKEQFGSLVQQAIPLTIFIGIISLGVTVARAVAVAVTESSGLASKVGSVSVTLFYGIVAVLVFTASSVG